MERIKTGGYKPPLDPLWKKLTAIPVGEGSVADYRKCVFEILERLFSPDLVPVESESADLVFRVDSEKWFWGFLKWEHSTDLLVFRPSNEATLDDDWLGRLATQLEGPSGSLGFFVTRTPPSLSRLERTFAIYGETVPRRVILILSDLDLKAMLDLQSTGRDPASYVQTLYRGFRASVQL